MSLENQIASLVTAANNLTNAVNGKISQIDQRVSQAVGQVPASIRAEVYKALYVDSATGSDANAGTQAAPLKSIKAALDKVMIGGVAQIYLARGRVYEVGVGASSQNDVTNKSLTFLPYGADPAKPVIRGMRGSVTDGTGRQIVCAFVTQSSMTLKFSDCRIETGAYDGMPGWGWGYGGFFSRGAGQGESAAFNIYIHKSEVLLMDAPLISTAYGFMNISLALAAVNKGGLESVLLPTGLPRVIDVLGSSFTGFGEGATLEMLLGITEGGSIHRNSGNSFPA